MPWEHQGNTRSTDVLGVLRHPETLSQAPGEPREDPQETTPREPRRGLIWEYLGVEDVWFSIGFTANVKTCKSKEREARQGNLYETPLGRS